MSVSSGSFSNKGSIAFAFRISMGRFEIKVNTNLVQSVIMFSRNRCHPSTGEGNRPRTDLPIQVAEHQILNAINFAETMGGVPSVKDL